jgi:hypothetical protein
VDQHHVDASRGYCCTLVSVSGEAGPSDGMG